MAQTGGAYEDDRNPIVRAADRMLEESESAQRMADLSFDPLNYSGAGKAPSGPAVTIPEEWLMKMAAFNRVANPAATAAAASGAPLSATQQRALRKLQQRRESRQAAANAGAEVPQADGPEVPIDESWIEELEESVVKNKVAKKKAKKGKGNKIIGSGGADPQDDVGKEEQEEQEEEQEEEEEEPAPAPVVKAAPKYIFGAGEPQAPPKAAKDPAAGAAENKSQPAKAKGAKAKDTKAPDAPAAAAQAPAAAPEQAKEPTAAESAAQAADKKKADDKKKKSYAEMASSWAAVELDESEKVIEQPVPRPEKKAPATDMAMTADAPDFIPFSMMQPQQQEALGMQGAGGRKDKRRGRDQVGAGGMGMGVDAYGQDPNSLPITTLMISNISGQYTPDTFRQQLDSWGLLGTYNFFYMPPMDDSPENTMATTCAFVNFVDPTFASFCQFLFQQYPFEGTATPFHVQGLESNIAHFSQFTTPDMINAPLILPTPTPSQMAVNGVNVMLNSKLSPQIRGQFHKTKLCVFNKKNKCALGATCPFAHSKEELQATPDLAKTKLCYNFFRRRCNDSKCKFAHGYQELRATTNVYKTELCRWWSHGGCKAGNACRYAHGVEELRGQDYGMGMMQDFGGDYSQPYYGMGPEDFGETAPGSWNTVQEPPPTGGLMVCGVNKPKMPSPPMEPTSNKGKAETAMETANENFARCTSGESSEFGFSESAFSRQSTMQVADFILRRQQTAPPAAMLAAVDEPSNDTIVLRVNHTFMEAVQLDGEQGCSRTTPMRRSWSDGDLPQLSEVMDMQDFDDM